VHASLLRISKRSEGPRPVCPVVVGSTNLGYWHPSTTLRNTPGYICSYGQSPSWCRDSRCAIYSQWETVRRSTSCTRVYTNILRTSRKAKRPRPLCRVVGSTNFGYWRPSTTCIEICQDRYTWSHELSPNIYARGATALSVPLCERVLIFVCVCVYPA
jgi:hypothetical protein